MKTHILSLLIALLILSHASCERVIDIEVRNTQSMIIIEGTITNEAGPHIVRITRSVGFSSPNGFPPVSGADVIIDDNVGNSERLIEVSPGVYATTYMNGVPGRSYTIKVSAEGRMYEAASTMPSHVKLDTVHVVQGTRPGGTFYYLMPQWEDPESEVNFYRCTEFFRNERVGAVLFDDVNSNGVTNILPLVNMQAQFQTGDTVLLELQSISPVTHRYFYALNEASDNNTAAPANPVSNFSNGALGYFSAHAVDRKTVIVR